MHLTFNYCTGMQQQRASSVKPKKVILSSNSIHILTIFVNI